jgi:hypothetical protein
MLHAVLPLLASLGTVPVSQQQITGYYQLTNDGSTGPCRGTTPNDNDRSAFGTNLLTTNTTDCNSCAALCSANVNITGYPRQCVAFECTPSLSDNVIGYLGRRCELWAKTPYFAGRSSCASTTDSSCNSPTDGYHCYVKTGNPFAAASASSTLAGNEASHSVVVALFVLILLMLIGMSALVFILFRRASVPAPMTRLHEVELNKK